VAGPSAVERISRRNPHRRAARLAAARRGVQIHLIGYLSVTIGVWLAIAVAAGAWYLWPVRPILGGGLGVISHAIPVRRYARKRHNLGLQRAFDDRTPRRHMRPRNHRNHAGQVRNPREYRAGEMCCLERVIRFRIPCSRALQEHRN
jgi:hypothetical protein